MEAPFRISDLQHDEMDQQGNRSNRKYAKTSKPHALGYPHDGLKRRRRSAIEQDALAQGDVAVVQHKKCGARDKNIGEQI